jgi:hypothetical protein
VSIIAACLLGDIKKYMDDHVAVAIHWWDLVAGKRGDGAGGGLAGREVRIELVG